MFKDIQKKLLLKYPLLWNTKFVPMLIIGVIYHILYFILGYTEGSIDFTGKTHDPDNVNYANSTFPAGTTTNTFVATDGSGNTSTCSFDVIIADLESPSISCPGSIVVSNDAIIG